MRITENVILCRGVTEMSLARRKGTEGSAYLAGEELKGGFPAEEERKRICLAGKELKGACLSERNG
jgi:hypothetical protein